MMVKAAEGKPEEHVIDIEPGKVYMLHAVPKMGAWVSRVKTNFVSLEEGVDILDSCKETKKPPRGERDDD